MTTPKPGAYRQLFIDALDALENNLEYTQNVQEIPQVQEILNKIVMITHYRALLNNPDYRFGKFNEGSNRNYASSELFLRS